MEYNIGDRIIDDKRDITIIDKKKLTRKYIYKYRCNICGYECQDGYRAGKPAKGLWRDEWDLNGAKKGCACCTSTIIVPEINSIAATHPELSKYFINGDEYKYTVQSNKRVDVLCPDCGYIKTDYPINLIYNPGFSCPICASSVPVGERILCALLDLQQINFKKEFQFPDSRKRYDFYLPDYNVIIEVNGSQHYVQTSNTWGSVKEQKENDKYKKQLALNQGISAYIVIDARISDFNHIKESIMNSGLADIISFDNVNWESIEDSINKNGRIKEMCEYWEQHPEATVVDMENKFHKSEKIIYDTLKVGYDMGWCHKRKAIHHHTSLHNNWYQRKNPVYDYNVDCNNNAMPIKHIEKNIYFKSIRLAHVYSKKLLDKLIPESTIRYKAKRNKEFAYVSRIEFNDAYNNGCICVGTPFDEAALITLGEIL